MVKVKVHRGEPANEGADILADKAISDPKVGKEGLRGVQLLKQRSLQFLGGGVGNKVSSPS